MDENLLEVKNLKKYFKTKHGTVHAVDDVSFTIKKGKTVTYKNKKLKKGKKYYYKVRAYKTVNKKTGYGAFSATRAVKVKR